MQKLKNVFNRLAKIIKKPLAAAIASLVLIFSPMLTKSAEPDREGAVKQLASQTTYWKNNDTGAVTEISPCAEKGLCVTILDIDEKSEGGKALYKEIKSYLDIDKVAHRSAENTQTGVLEICGLTLKNKFKPDYKGNWSSGSVFSSFFIKVNDDSKLSVGGSFVLFSSTRIFNQIAKPAATCMDRIKQTNNPPAQNTAPKMAP